MCLWHAGSSRCVGRRASAEYHRREARLKENNITLPPVPPPVANYVNSVQVGKLVFLAGNTAGAEWKYKGKVGKDITEQEGYDSAASRTNHVGESTGALGSLDRVKRVVKVLGMVNSAEGFGAHRAPAPSAPSSCTNEFDPTKDITTNSASILTKCASLMNSATGL